jgi:hypothetical protein
VQVFDVDLMLSGYVVCDGPRPSSYDKQTAINKLLLLLTVAVARNKRALRPQNSLIIIVKKCLWALL